MSSNELKRMIVFTNAENKKIIENYISMEQAIYKRPLSYLYEEHLFGDMLPKNKNAFYWMRNLFADTTTITETLDSIFSYLSGGLYLHARATNAKQIVEYTHEYIQLRTSTVDLPYDKYEYIVQQVELIYDYVKQNSMTDTDSQNKANTLLKIARQPLESILYPKDYVSDIINFLLGFWEKINDYTYTYRVLVGIVKASYIERDEYSVLELNKLLKEISKDWE